MKAFLSSLVFTLLPFLPKKALSWFLTRLLYLPLPAKFASFSVRFFARLYGIPENEAEKPIDAYTCIGEFFSRKMPLGLRPLASAPCVHPVDASLLSTQRIQTGQELYQAKGQTYNLCSLLGQEESKKREVLSFWQSGLALTYYLCPRDYHRIHCPFDARVTQVTRIQGTLWPVHAWARQNIPQLFCRNERLLLYLESTQNPQMQGVLICIGALNVGSIVLAFPHEDKGKGKDKDKGKGKNKDKPVFLKKGQEVALFRMGSSVVFLANASLGQQFELDPRFGHELGSDQNTVSLTLDQQVRQVYMGQAI